MDIPSRPSGPPAQASVFASLHVFMRRFIATYERRLSCYRHRFNECFALNLPACGVYSLYKSRLDHRCALVDSLPNGCHDERLPLSFSGYGDIAFSAAKSLRISAPKAIQIGFFGQYVVFERSLNTVGVVAIDPQMSVFMGLIY